MYKKERFILLLIFILVVVSYILIVTTTYYVNSVETKKFLGNYFIAPFTILVHLAAWFYPFVILIKNRKLFPYKKLLLNLFIILAFPVMGSVGVMLDKNLKLV